ncbi:hypothetical protein IFT36_02480 [Frigoribacterium sp. CFBP 13605]|uniref:hypothetical protein n=1 Tax=Frigoribacterium sp. CFBP 13605 TaxID=2774034 RepID=UPI0019085C27|nr:hypothetical protein [Frigoribacterium sp. CFBP 13605]MBD8139411.1 hypothetical protein [Frigoribacterium sp. CFBP 13605]
MTNWLRALAPLALTTIALVVFFTADRTVGMLLIVAALASAFLVGTGAGQPTRASRARRYAATSKTTTRTDASPR